MTVTPSRDEEIKLIWTENQWLYMVVGFIAGVLFCLLTQLSVLNLPELVRDLLPEAAGILVTITVIDQLNRRRDSRNAIKQLQEELVRNAGSMVNDVANNAVHQLRKRGWLQGKDGLLSKAILSGANLQGAFLIWANLQGAKLFGANLQGADLINANLQEADLEFANLQGAELLGANLQGGNLTDANLQGVDLGYANLQGANLWRANLQGAELEGAEFNEKTCLPDRSYWTPDTDMSRFTEPDNKDGSE